MAENITETVGSGILSPEYADKVFLASGYAHPELAVATASELGVGLGPVERRMFHDGERYVRYQQSVRGKHVIIMQTHASTPEGSVNDAIQEQLLMVDSARTSSASEITVVCPYLGYSRQDRKSKGREPISARVVIDQLGYTGARRIVAIDLHSPQTQAIFRGPFDHLTAQPLLRSRIRPLIDPENLESFVVIAPDSGSSKMVGHHSDRLGLEVVHLPKKRDRHNSHHIVRIGKPIPQVRDRVCFMFDDMISTAGTLRTAANDLHDSGARSIYAVATHGLFVGSALDCLQNAPIDRIFVTDTRPVEHARKQLGDKLEVVSVAPMIGRALMEIITNGSVSDLFADQNHM